eukprot:SAG25_NODE_397_length_8510_cov_7.345619_3_plen_364_part_00
MNCPLLTMMMSGASSRRTGGVHRKGDQPRSGVDADAHALTRLRGRGPWLPRSPAAAPPMMTPPVNQGCPLLQLLQRRDMRNNLLCSGEVGVVCLWRWRRVSVDFRRWCTELLCQSARPVAMGSRWGGGPSVEALDLATMRWSSDIAVPPLPPPLGLSECAGATHAGAVHSVATFLCTRQRRQETLVLAGGWNEGYDYDDTQRHSLQARCWSEGRQEWEQLPDMAAGRAAAVVVALADGRTLVAGGWNRQGRRVTEVEALSADSSGWVRLAPMRLARAHAVAGQLPTGQVIVAGGWSDFGRTHTVEMWDPVTDSWSALPPMNHVRSASAGCVLRSGRFVVVGGLSSVGASKDGEIFDSGSSLCR